MIQVLPSKGPLQYPEASFQEGTVVLDCQQPRFAVADVRIVSQSGEVFARYLVGDPEDLDLSKGIAIAPSDPAATLKNIVCDEDVRTPLVTKTQLASMKFSNLAITPDFEVYYQVLQSEGTPSEKDAIVLYRKTKENKIGDLLPAFRGSLVELGTAKMMVGWYRFHCKERTYSVLKSELYDASNELKFISGADSTQRSSAEQLNPLQQTLCGPPEVEK